MTDNVLNSNLGLPAGNGSQALFFNSVTLGDSIVEYVTITFPPGCAGLVGVRLEYNVVPVYPTPSGNFFIFDDFTFTVNISDRYRGGQWRAVGYNQDTYFHTIRTYWGWNYLKHADSQSAATLISLLGGC